MLLKVYEDNPSEKTLGQIVRKLESGGIIIYPTDSVYAFGCSLKSPQGIAKLLQITGKESDRLTLVCSDLSNIADYANVDNPTFRELKRNIPGPFTFILKASSKVPDKILARRKTVGIRVPNNKIAVEIVKSLGVPLVSSSVREDSDGVEYTTDPELIYEKYFREVDIVIDGGYGDVIPTTIVEFDDDQPTITRQGKGELR